MELPFHLKALPPEALDVIRFLGKLDEPIAHADYIMGEVGLSERTFGKVIRRLVTKGYIQMAGDQTYRLTDHGYAAVDELAGYEDSAPPESAPQTPARVQVRRRLVLVMPRALVAGALTDIYVGFNVSDQAHLFSPPADLVVRLSILNGEPARPQEEAFSLSDKAEYCVFQITAGLYTRVRLRLNVFQLGPNPDDIGVSGGMYVDTDVIPAPDAAASDLRAYGTDVTILV